MTEIQKYLAEEVAEDLADGIITRREAMRRLGLLGLSASAASGLLVTFTSAPAAAAAPATAGDGGRPPVSDATLGRGVDGGGGGPVPSCLLYTSPSPRD